MHAILPSLGSSITHGKRKETKKTQCYSTEYMAGGVQKTADSTNLDHGCEVSQAMDRDTGTGVVGSPDACRWGHGDDEKPTDRLRIPPRGTCSPAPVGVLPSGLYISGSILKPSLLAPVIGTRALNKHICMSRLERDGGAVRKPRSGKGGGNRENAR
ncbi:40S ribosomal protein S22 [Fusarium oxysporum f. sp. albedinis]|nr:40S ribosomal protein S22 [Fusarium oxysporum f. sp. albedinis]